MKIATWNVNSVVARLPLVLRWLDAVRPDVLCLQEIKCEATRFPVAELAALGYRSEIYGQPTYNGVAIISRQPCEDVGRGFPDDEAGAHARLLAATVDGVRIINVYVPNGQSVGSDKFDFKLRWMRRLREYLDEECWTDSDVLLCGDFNVAPEDEDVHDPQQWRGRILFSKPEHDALQEIKNWGLTDSFRLHTKGSGHYSWWDYRAGSFPRNTGLRIDHVWVSESLAERCTACRIDKEPRGWERPSDHTPVMATFS